MKNILFFLIYLFFNTFCIGQQLFESGIIYGGVTGGGFSTNTGSGTITTNVAIPANSIIKKAYLLAARDGEAPNITVTLNGLNYIFSNATVITDTFVSGINSTWTWDKSTIHAINITNNIDSSITSYNLAIPPQFNVTVDGFYSSFYIYIIYENIFLPKIAYNLFINEQDVSPLSVYNLFGFNPIDNNKDVGLGLLGVFFCDTLQDGSYVNVNGNQLGLLGGQESNTLNSCTGVYANFSYYNDTLFGLEDDTHDSLMAATDALANIKSYVNNGDVTVDIIFTYQTPSLQNGRFTNPISAFFLTYTTPCDTFSTTITETDTICLGDSIQLNATGGVQYSWYSPFSTFNDTTIANPVATPSQTTTYIVTIKNDSGCVKTEQVKIWVNPLPIADTLIVTPNFCGDSVASVSVGNIPSGNLPYTYTLTNLQTTNSNTQNTNVFTGLGTGDYELQITDNNGCLFTDTATITETNIVQANFTATPQSGLAPLLVDFSNTSVNANNYFWEITSLPFDSAQGALIQDSSFNTQYLFDSSGTYQICLVAYNNIPTCADTICKTIVVNDTSFIGFILPNVFTPNQDGENDNFIIQLTGADLIKELKVEVFNRWGQQMKNVEFKMENINNQSSIYNNQLYIWDGYTTAAKQAPEGTYYYVVTYQTETGEVKTEKGDLLLLR